MFHAGFETRPSITESMVKLAFELFSRGAGNIRLSERLEYGYPCIRRCHSLLASHERGHLLEYFGANSFPLEKSVSQGARQFATR